MCRFYLIFCFQFFNFFFLNYNRSKVLIATRLTRLKLRPHLKQWTPYLSNQHMILNYLILNSFNKIFLKKTFNSFQNYNSQKFIIILISMELIVLNTIKLFLFRKYKCPLLWSDPKSFFFFMTPKQSLHILW